MIEAGQPAPTFTLPDQDGREVSLEDLRGRPVVIYFYPKDDTPGCTRQACSLRDGWDALAEAGVAVVGVSPDDAESHARFADRHALPFPLLADPDRTVLTAYGVWGEKSFYGVKSIGVTRTTFLIDPEGIIRHVFKRPAVDRHADEILTRVRALTGA